MRPSTDDYFMEMAGLVAGRSTCVRRSVGCVLVDRRNHVLATGYNGVPSGAPHCNDLRSMSPGPLEPSVLEFPHACAGARAKSGHSLDSCMSIHAEQNAILQCRDAHAIKTAYVTAFPCPTCAKLLLNTSCEMIVFENDYGDNAGYEMWVAAGRVAQRHDGAPHMLQKDIVDLFKGDDLCEWRVVVACLCIALGSARRARGIVFRILERWPTPKKLALADDMLEAMLTPLGLQVRRAGYLRSVSKDWGVASLYQLPGVGKYAVDSVDIFCRGVTPKDVSDRKLEAYLAWTAKAAKP